MSKFGRRRFVGVSRDGEFDPCIRRQVKNNSGKARLSMAAASIIIILLLGFLFVTVSQRSPIRQTPEEGRGQLARFEKTQPVAAVPNDLRRAIGTPAQHAGVNDSLRPGIRGAEIRGRFVDFNGQGVEGVPVLLRAAPEMLGPDRGAKSNANWPSVSTASDELGRFLVTFSPPADLAFALTAEPARLCPVSWSWESFQPHEIRDLGDIQLRQGGNIVGLLLDSQGNPLHGPDWIVRVIHSGADTSKFREPFELRCHSNPATGEFLVEGVLPGTVLLRAECAGTSGFNGPPVDVKPGETAYVELECPEAAIASRISVIPSCPPFGPVTRAPPIVTALDNGTVFQAARPTDQTRCFTFDNLPSGTYDICIDDPRFRKWNKSDVQLGELVQAQLRGSASIHLTVTAQANGLPITAYSASIQLEDKSWGNMLVPILTRNDDAGSPEILDGILPVFQTLIVRADGYAESYTEIADLSPGEIRSLSVQLARGCTIAGTVVCSGTAYVNQSAMVRLVPQSRITRGVTLLEDVQTSQAIRSAETDQSSGQFTISNVPSGAYLIQASASPTVHSGIGEIRIEPDLLDYKVELDLPDYSYLRVHAFGAPTWLTTAAALMVVPSSFPMATNGVVASLDWRRKLQSGLLSEGILEFGPLPTGEAQLWLTGADFVLPEGIESESTTAGSAIELGLIVLAPGVNEHELDLRKNAPGRLLLSISAAGQPTSGLTVQLCRNEGTYLAPEAATVTNGELQVGLGPIRQDKYVLIIQSIGKGWNWIASPEVGIANGIETNLTCELPIATEGVLKVRRNDDTRSAALGSVQVLLDSNCPVPPVIANLDLQGSVRLTLPAGRYRLCYLPPNFSGRPGAGTPFDWPAPAGKSDVEVIVLSR